jgi:predicted aminopeptidase
VKYLLLSLLFFSCAKFAYISEQGLGQVALEYNDIDNDDFIKDPNQSKVHKEKVLLIEKAKTYFYKYFDLEQVSIYDEVKILDQKAVTYLVIHAPINEVRAIETSFPLVGSFPYLGFFSIKSAKEFKQEKEEQGFHTYLRPVYAYSTLNHPLWPFDDNILSSFFYYKDKDLVELIFHELVHTVLFVGDNVEFNENIAQFIAAQLVKDYFQYNQLELEKLKQLNLKKKEINMLITQSSKELNLLYQGNDDAPQVMNKYLKNIFIPNIKKQCQKLSLAKCWPLTEQWNNARFAAFGTYEAKQDLLAEIYIKSKLGLKKYVLKLIHLAKKHNKKEDFLKMLAKEM